MYWQGKPDRAWDLYEEAVTIRRGLGDVHAVADALFQAAWAAAGAYDIERATKRARRARALYEQSGDTTSAQLVTNWILIEPVVLGAGGDPETAIATAEATYQMTKAVGRAHDAADWLSGRAMLHRIQGDPARGLPVARDAIAAWYELGNLGRLPLALKVLAAIELQAGEPRRAVRLEAAARRLGDEVGGDLYQVFGQLGDVIEEARPLLDPEDHARAIEEGRTRSLAEQVAYALRGDEDG